MTKVQVDPIRLELIKNALVSICDNMMVAVVRTARSTNIKNSMDFSATICDGQGQLVGQGIAVPAHLGAMMPALRGSLDYFGDDIVDGDIMVSNDPYAGCSHLNDIFMFKPVFVGGERIGFLCIIIHHTDLGGRVPGGNATDSGEIFQEGLRIPASKIWEAGKPNKSILRMIEHNTRIPTRTMGDIYAQIATLNVAEKDLRKLVIETGVAEFKVYTQELIDYTERLTRAKIAALPDGEAEFTDWNDDDGAGGPPIKFHVKVIKRGDEFAVDFTGTSPQGRGSMHTNHSFMVSCTYATLRTVIDRDIPNNAGFFKPITIIAPEGSFVNVRYPAALGARGQGGLRIRSVVFGALAQLFPNLIPACPGGSEFAIVFAGYAGEKREHFLHLEYHNTSGLGGGPDKDGQEGGPYCIANLANVPCELIEAENPVLVEEYAFLPDSGGAGKYRGALGVARQYRLLSDETTVNLRSDRHLHPCWGLFGGKAGSLSRSIVNPGTDRMEAAPSKFLRVMNRGDVFRGEFGGSGGYGDPMERDIRLVAEDLKQGKVTVQHALEAYGVVAHHGTLKIDMEATRRQRARKAV